MTDSWKAPKEPAITRDPKVGERWRSRDTRDNGLLAEILVVNRGRVVIQRFRKTVVRLDRFHRDYEYAEQNGD